MRKEAFFGETKRMLWRRPLPLLIAGEPKSLDLLAEFCCFEALNYEGDYFSMNVIGSAIAKYRL